VLDESHAAGVIGEQSRGTAEACGLAPRRDVAAFTGTFSKAFGAGGEGYIAGSTALMNEVKRAARFYIFNTGMQIATVGAAIVGVEKESTDSERRDRLRANTERLRKSLTKIGFNLLGGDTPITPILVDDEEKALCYFKRLSERRIVAPVMAYPIVPLGEARLCLQPSASHTEHEIDVACDILAQEAEGLHLID
jgi:glycine C-acetyltransferase